MKAGFRGTFRDGIRQFAEHPQLWLTVFVASAIFASFIYVAYQFSGIAQEAHERLVNVRVGSLHDGFVPLATELADEPIALRDYMTTITRANPTIRDFSVVTYEGDQWVTRLSASPQTEGTTFLGYDFLLTLAETDPRNSFTVEEVRGSERLFVTVRAIPSFQTGSSTLRAIAVTRQTLSEADRQIAARIRESVLVLLVILLILLYLFFRHARIIDYAVLYQKLKEVDHMKDDFISMASHELRTPLTAIRGYADELRTSGPRPNAEIERLFRIDTYAKELDQLIADILDVSRIQEGRLSYRMEEVSPRKSIMAVSDSLRPIAEQKAIALTVDVSEELRILADTERLRQVMTNIIGNAIKYTPKGEVRIHASQEKDRIIIRVSDSGIGMTADEQKRLFEKFYRASGRDVQEQTGTGLGLWITKQLVEGMQGSISVESIKGVGSHFILSFPLTRKSA